MRAFKVALALGAAGALSGCQLLGPESISYGRLNYNNVIQETAKEQVFENIVRVHKREPTLFVDVTEVDASVTAQASAGGSIAGIGGKAPATEGVTAGLTYSESPVVRYFPLLGQPLVQQVSSPITADSLAYLFDSNWAVPAVMQLSVDRMTPRFSDYGAALNAIIALDNYDALVIAAYPSAALTTLDVPKPAASKKSGDSGGGGGGGGGGGPSITSLPNDALVLYLEAERPGRGSQATANDAEAEAAARNILHLWIRLLRIYEGTQRDTEGLRKLCPDESARDACLAKLDRSVGEMDAKTVGATLHLLPGSIELRTRPLPPALMATGAGGYDTAAPILRTRSALGVLKAGAEYSGSLIRFVSQERYDALRAAAWNAPSCANTNTRDYYMVLSAAEMNAPVSVEAAPPGAGGSDGDDRAAVVNRIKTGDCDMATMRVGEPLDMNDAHLVSRELMLAGARAFILVAEGTPPPDAYVSYSDGGRSYYIAGDDAVSKLNFALLSQLLTMQAVASPGASSTATISIGGH